MWATTKYVSVTWMSTGIVPSITPDSPPIANVMMKPIANSRGVLRWSFPSQRVPSHEKTLMPVGMAMMIVVIIIGTRSQAAMPLTNMWWAQTPKPSTAMATVENASAR